MLLELRESTRPEKKLMAIFESHAPVHFGARGYGDYLSYKTKDPEVAELKRRAYIARHRVTENWTNPYAPGTLSRYILWEFSRDPIKKYNQMFFSHV